MFGRVDRQQETVATRLLGLPWENGQLALLMLPQPTMMHTRTHRLCVLCVCAHASVKVGCVCICAGWTQSSRLGWPALAIVMRLFSPIYPTPHGRASFVTHCTFFFDGVDHHHHRPHNVIRPFFRLASTLAWGSLPFAGGNNTFHQLNLLTLHIYELTK